MFDAGIYPVITEKFCKGRKPEDVLYEVIKGGAKVVQLREKELSKRMLFYLAMEFRAITSRVGVKLIINDHLDLALAVGADGVHLGQKDLPCASARKIAPDMIIGVSTHCDDEAIWAEVDGASYVNIGPIFPTNTKKAPIESVGIEELKKIRKQIRIPFTVMGGIKESNIKEVLDAGATRVAMVTEITEAREIAEKVKRLQDMIIGS